MRKVCSEAHVLWSKVCRCVTMGDMEKYYIAWREYIKHKHECEECQILLEEYLKQEHTHVCKSKSAHVVSCDAGICVPGVE